MNCELSVLGKIFAYRPVPEHRISTCHWTESELSEPGKSASQSGLTTLRLKPAMPDTLLGQERPCPREACWVGAFSPIPQGAAEVPAIVAVRSSGASPGGPVVQESKPFLGIRRGVRFPQRGGG